MSSVDYSARIPNNVHLSDNRRLRRALEAWQPAFLKWWQEMGPMESGNHEVYLRTAVSVDRQGWANFGFTRLPEYRWGIFLADQEPDRKIAFGEHKGDSVWQEVPGEYRAALRRLIVIQGDTEPASVEQQRHLGLTCPSLYDLRNLFQVNVEEARHLWAMTYLLHAYFGRDGREQADELLVRRSGDPDKPRILGAFNERTSDWLSFYMFTFFTDRDGKFQLCSLAESAFDPLARTCRFMLTEEAHHMFIGITGLSRIVERTCEVMREHQTDDVREFGAIDLEMFQRHLNFHCSVTLDLFGAEESTNAALSYATSLKGRFQETKLDDDHRLNHSTYPVLQWQDTRFENRELPALNTLNERLREDYVADVNEGIARLNGILKKHGVDFHIKLPHRAFNRKVGSFADLHVSPDGKVMSEQEWSRHQHEWLPTEEDKEYLRSLMPKAITVPGRFASWIAPPSRGINDKPIEFEYVRLG
ncbi:MAG: benzoyl-CoA 2,3-epoxidase subunit BoxB [Gammaproteobacteria bacterium]|nr:benzoyl-CoA 2,3-epoxidase subunit BoxB [Gammaproteobacteria bacterium]